MQRQLKSMTRLIQLQNMGLSVVLILKLIKLKKKGLRRWGTKPHLYQQVRQQFGAYDAVCLVFRLTDHEEFLKFTRMSPENFDHLHELVRHRLTKMTNRRQPISSVIRLASTLHYLGHGGNVRSIALFFRVGRSTLYEIIATTCKILQDILMPLYVPLPNEEGWLQIAEDFYNSWNFPNCLGALDGKQIEIDRPAHGGSLFFNYKKYNSVNLMALSDSHSRFTWFSVGDFGSYSDSSVFGATEFARKLETNQLNIPHSRPLPNTDTVMPFVIVADEIFPLGFHLMKPYNRRLINNDVQRIFNYRLSRSRFTIECAFGILCSKWQVLNDALAFNLDTNDYVISACICLHNYLITRNRGLSENVERRRNARPAEVINEKPRGPSIVRDDFARYFSSEAGAVPWQHLYI